MEVRNIIIDFIKTEIHNDRPDLELDLQADLLSAGILDSLSMMRLIQHMEDVLAIQVKPMDMTIDNFITVEAMDKYFHSIKPNQ